MKFQYFIIRLVEFSSDFLAFFVRMHHLLASFPSPRFPCPTVVNQHLGLCQIYLAFFVKDLLIDTGSYDFSYIARKTSNYDEGSEERCRQFLDQKTIVTLIYC